MSKENKFMKYEIIYFRVYLFIVAFGLFMLSLVYAAQNSIEEVARGFLSVVYTFLIVTIIQFIISIIRIIKYLIRFKSQDEVVQIWRSVTIMLTSPVAFAIYLILTLAMSLSLASCS
jgi:hypothetical protein